jgi:hypothetical protein
MDRCIAADATSVPVAREINSKKKAKQSKNAQPFVGVLGDPSVHGARNTQKESKTEQERSADRRRVV